jgi:hypothetical protein
MGSLTSFVMYDMMGYGSGLGMWSLVGLGHVGMLGVWEFWVVCCCWPDVLVHIRSQVGVGIANQETGGVCQQRALLGHQ